MATQLHQTGEQFIQEYTFIDGVSKPANVQVGLYHDATDTLNDGDDYGAITSEPGSGNYGQQDVPFDTNGFNVTLDSGDYQAETSGSVTFDVTNTTENVDAYFVIVNYDDGSGSAADHLFWTGDLSQEYDLSNLDQLEIDAGGVALALD